MKIISTKTETMCLSRQPKQCSFQIGGVPLNSQINSSTSAFSLTGDGRQNSELNIRIGKASAVMRQLHRSVVLNGNFAPGQSYHFQISLCSYSDLGHECWIMNEKVRSRVQAAEIFAV